MSSQVTDLHAVLQWYLPWHKVRVMIISAFILSLLKVALLHESSFSWFFPTALVDQALTSTL